LPWVSLFAVKPCRDYGCEQDDAASRYSDCATSSDQDGHKPGTWAGFALSVGWCFFGLVVYYCFAVTTPPIEPSDFSLLQAVFLGLLLGPLAVLTYGHWMLHND
jgi:hypothetical protein